jgi:endonuclease/exonuclease/phosphatase family metal-dependent hydrolase
MMKTIVPRVVAYLMEPYSAEAASDGPRTLHCLQYKICWKDTGDAGSEDYFEGRMHGIVKAARPYDIVCLEGTEQMGPELLHSFVNKCRKNGFRHVLSQSGPGFVSKHISDTGILVLSKLLVSDHSCLTFQREGESRLPCYHGAIHAKIEISNTESIHIIACQLHDADEIDESESLTELHGKNLRRIADLIRGNCGDEIPVLLCGGFNIDSNCSEEYDLFATELIVEGFDLINLSYREGKGHPITRIASNNRKAASVDYTLYFRPHDSTLMSRVAATVRAFRVSDRPYSQISNHNGLSVAMELAS